MATPQLLHAAASGRRAAQAHGGDVGEILDLGGRRNPDELAQFAYNSYGQRERGNPARPQVLDAVRQQAEADPINAQVQRDLSVYYERLGSRTLLPRRAQDRRGDY